MSGAFREKFPLIWDVEAEKQWNEILLFFAERNGSLDYSLQLDDRLGDLLELIRKEPEMGEKTNRPNTRRHVFGNYAVFYRIGDNRIEVVGVRDARRDVPLD